MVKHCRAQKCTVEIETYRAYDTLLSYSMEDQGGKRDIFALLPHTHTLKLTLCFLQERLRKLESGKVIQCWNLNRIVLFRQPWISQIRSTDKCDAGNKGQERNMPKIGAKFSREENDNECLGRKHLVCICITTSVISLGVYNSMESTKKNTSL